MQVRALLTPLLAALAGLGVVACGDNLAPPGDARAADAADLDAPADAAAVDAAEIDAPTDAALDAPTDAATIDAPTDAPTDAAIDAIPVDAPVGPVTLRVVAANVTSGNFQAYEAPGIHILAALDPDVALIQEFNVGGNSLAELRGFVDQAFAPGFYYFREAGVQLPNGVVSRYPILAAGSWEDPEVNNRDFAWARIDVPGPIDLWAVSMHLLTSSASARSAEASALVAAIAAHVPAGDYLVIGGDFNTPGRTEGCLTTFGAIVDTAPPYPADGAGNGNTNAGRTKSYDWVLADPDLEPLVEPLALGTSTFATGLVFDTRVYLPLSDAPPAVVSDSGAVNMQHMAVARDFLLPNPP